MTSSKLALRARSSISYPTYHRRPAAPSMSEMLVCAAITSRSPLSLIPLRIVGSDAVGRYPDRPWRSA